MTKSNNPYEDENDSRIEQLDEDVDVFEQAEQRRVAEEFERLGVSGTDGNFESLTFGDY